ncbi:structural cement protein Gp24 [Parasutterella excrementihominis]|uniref:structural cement protein Gp24 n=1 Tax=Parasutterella excrementihominis TaxID=487175 RepID=UPI003FEEC472
MLQKTVNLYPAIGIPGQQVAFNQAVYTPHNYLSDGTVACGTFAFAKAAAGSTTAVQFPIASATGAAGDKVVGLVERTFTASLPSYDEDTDIYPEGAELTIAERGDYYIVAPAAATVGQSVLCDPTTGNITFGAAGAANDTGWVVRTAGAKDDTIIISNHGLSITPAAASGN